MRRKRRGQCLVCGVEGQGTKNFLCENCADPEKIIWICVKCGKKVELTEGELEKLYEALKVCGKYPIRKGIVIKDLSCPRCTFISASKEERKVYIYAISKKYLRESLN
jgi:Fe2+ or Zn2+ uptake regulation protein